MLRFVLLIFLAGCSSGPRAQPIAPPSFVLEEVASDAAQDPLIQPSDNIPEEWWTLFADPQLSDFIGMALTQNPTLQAAQANIMSTLFFADQVKSALYPTLGWGGDVSRQKLSETGLIPFNSQNSPGATPGGSGLPIPAGKGGIPVYFTQYETELALTYDFDIWGKNRNALRAALGEVQASIADEAFRRLQLSVAVAQVYYELQTGYAREDIAKALVENKRRFRELTQGRVQGNLNELQTSAAAHSNESNAVQQLLQIKSEVAVNEYRLKALLAGQFDEMILDARITAMKLPKVPLPSDLPLHLIARRPDVVSQLWIIESAGKQIEVAKAGFYPDFNLVAFFGFQTIHLHELFFSKSKFFNVDPAFSLPIFEGGRLQANLRGSEVNYDLAIYKYNELVINAAKEVLEGIVVLRNRELQEEESRKTLGYQDELLHLSRLRVEHNLNSDLDYLQVEEGELRARDGEVVAKGAVIQAILTLIKALGGGFDVCIEN